MSNAAYEPQDPNAIPVQKSGKGCFFYGCLASVVLIVLILVCSGGVYWYAMGQFQKYTSATPQELPVVELEEAELQELEGRVDGFKNKLESGATVEPLILTADEINAMIARDEDVRGKVFVKINDGQITGDVSIPIANRYLNASASFEASIVNDNLFVNLKSASVKGEPVPQEFIDQMGAENLAKEFNKNPEASKVIKRLESISIEGDKIILIPKAETGEAEQPVEQADAEQASEPADASDPSSDNADSDAADPQAVPAN
ncbi:MAG: hypothetical protein R3C05_24420 [Pirellulaceae bacterium]